MTTWDLVAQAKPAVDALDQQVSSLTAQRDLLLDQVADLKAKLAALTPPTTAFGWSNDANTGETNAAALARRDSTLGKGAVIRLYSPPRKGTKCFKVSDRSVMHSFKDALTDAEAIAYFTDVNTWLNANPDLDWYWTYYHEPEDNIAAANTKDPLTKASFLANWRRLRAIQKKYAPRASATLILMGWSLDPRSKRNWRDYYPGDDVIDVLGWDTYSLDATRDPAEVFGRCVDVGDSLGKPTVFGEWGAPNGDLARPHFITTAGAYFIQRHVEAACYWDSQTKEHDYRLIDSASQAAMQDLLKGK